MSKRNITPKSGKQLYLNQSFLKGMLYTTSEMQEGYTKLISNFDVSPTGDSLVPRAPVNSYFINKNLSQYTYPIKFRQAVKQQHFVSFTNTITEDEYYKYNEGDVKKITNPSKGILMYSRPIDLFNSSTMGNLVDIEGSTNSEPDISLQNDIRNFRLERTKQNLYIYFGTDNYIDITDCTTNISNLDLYDINKVTMKDADSGIIDLATTGNVFETFSYRLICVNSPEEDNEWYEYGKVFVDRLLNNRWSILQPNSFCYKYYGSDVHDRALIRMFLKYNDTFIDVNKLLVKLGLADIDYVYNNVIKEKEFINELIEIRNNSNLNMFDDYAIDPFYNYKHNNINYINDNYIVQAVRIESKSYPSHKVTNEINEVKFIYNDLLDAIGFIAAIIDLETSEIVYKGPVFLKSVKSKTLDTDSLTGNTVVGYGRINFELYLPPNDFNGTLINSIEGATNGYNILDKHFIHNEDTEDYNKPFSILGIVPTTPEDESIIIDQAVQSQNVKLNAVINKGYFYNNAVTSTELFGFNMNIDYKTSTFVEDDELGETIIEDADFYKTIVKNKNDTEQLIVTNYKTEFENIVINELKLNITSSTQSSKLLYKTVTPNTLTFKTQDYSNNVLNIRVTNEEDLFDIRLLIKQTKCTKYTDSNTNTESYMYHYNIEVYHNLNNISKVLSYNDITQSFDLIDRVNTNRNTYFYTKWEVGRQDNTLEVISPEKLTYYTTSDNNIVQQYESITEDVVWNVNVNGNVPVKFSIIPRIKSTTNEDPNYYLYNFEISNNFQVMELTMPIFKIGTEPKFISEDDVKENIDIKNATRIGIFNRQVFLYGPYTKSNFVQFSKFEEEWYYPFPYYSIEFDEPIVYIKEYKDSLVVFTTHSIYMLTGSESILDCSKYKIYENLTTSITDINLINPVGNYLMFFNNNMGYIIVPNTYSDDPSNIKVYKLSENIINLFDDPEHYIRTKSDVPVDAFLYSIYNNPISYVQGSEIFIVNNYSFKYSINGNNYNKRLVSISVYNTDYKYWKIYDIDSQILSYITSVYVCEPYLNKQFIGFNNYGACLSLINNINNLNNEDTVIGKSIIKLPIRTYIESGYLSVDTMNEKRFKDLILEFDKLNGDSPMKIKCNFYIDGAPVLINDTDALLIDTKLDSTIEISCIKELEYDSSDYSKVGPLYNYEQESNFYGVVYSINTDNKYFASNRTHLRIPLYGKGRLPSFSIEITKNNSFEFINYSIIYKEKNINRRR